MGDRVCGVSAGFRVIESDLIDMGGERPVRLIRQVVRLNDEPVEVLVPEDVAGVGADGEYRTGAVVNPDVVRRAMRLTDLAELGRMGAQWA